MTTCNKDTRALATKHLGLHGRVDICNITDHQCGLALLVHVVCKNNRKSPLAAQLLPRFILK